MLVLRYRQHAVVGVGQGAHGQGAVCWAQGAVVVLDAFWRCSQGAADQGAVSAGQGFVVGASQVAVLLVVRVLRQPLAAQLFCDSVRVLLLAPDWVLGQFVAIGAEGAVAGVLRGQFG